MTAPGAKSSDRAAFLREYVTALREGEAALFVGAGLSREAGYVDWKQLLKEIAEDLGLDVNREGDLVALAQYHVNHRGGRDRLNQLLIDEFLEGSKATRNHRLIATLPLPTIWTTNYDALLETTLESAGRRVTVKRRQDDFALSRRRTDTTIYKMHGDQTLPADAVLTKEDYETYDAKRELFTVALKGDLAEKTFLFLGFSFADPNVVHVLERVRRLLESNSRMHFCVLREPKSGTSVKATYERTRYSHWLKDLHRYNIQPVLIQDYGEVTEILEELNRRSHLKDVFVSGSAEEFAPMGYDAFQGLCLTLGRELIRKGFNIISGFGSGVADSLIVGAMQALPRNDDVRLQLWPFPQAVPKGSSRAAVWREYRERMLAGAGTCVVLAGNKLRGGKITLAAGVQEEVAIARAQGKPVIPVGSTGHVALNEWKRIRADAKDPLRNRGVENELAMLGNTQATSAALAGAVIEILRQLDR